MTPQPVDPQEIIDLCTRAFTHGVTGIPANAIVTELATLNAVASMAALKTERAVQS